MTDLLEHQRGDIDFIHRERRVLLANEPGLGKSRSALSATEGANRTLVIAPNLVLQGGTWDDEIKRWAEDRRESIVCVSYSMLNARASTGRGSGSRPVAALREGVRGVFEAVIVDEAHYTKGRKTSWTWAVEEICKKADIVVEMTGTPIPNWSHELFNILRVIWPEEAKRGTGKYGGFWRWAGEWFDTSPTRFSNGMPVVGEMKACYPECLRRPPYDPCDHYRRFTEENLGPKYRRMLRDDCLDLPPLTRQIVSTPLDTEGKRIYKELKKDFATTVDEQDILAWSQGAKNVLLDKVTTSPWLLTKQGKPRGGKLETLRFDLENRARPTLVLAHYRDSVEACAEVARSVGASATTVHGGVSDKDRSRRVADFKAGKTDVLVGSLETLAEGLTLTVADMAIFVESSYKPSRNVQATYRIHRMGQDRPCTIRDYRTPNTVDARKHRLLETKNDRQMRVLTAAEFQALL